MWPVVVEALRMGFILAPLALGVFITYRIYDFPDMTADASFVTGGAVSIMAILSGWHPITSLILAMLAGAAAGFVTGALHTLLKVKRLLAGILVMTALYSVNILVMGGRPNAVFDGQAHLFTLFDGLTRTFFGELEPQEHFARANELGTVILGVATALLCFGLHLFFRTRAGLALRASGTSGQALAALSAPVNILVVSGIMLSNALVALSGALFAHRLGSTDVRSGVGMLVFGLGAVIIGEGLFGKRSFIRLVYATVAGAIFFRLATGVVLQAGEMSSMFKLYSAIIVLFALVIPRVWQGMRNSGAPNGGTD